MNTHAHLATLARDLLAAIDDNHAALSLLSYGVTPQTVASSFGFPPGNNGHVAINAGTTFAFPLDGLRTGDRIKSVTFQRFGDGVADITTAAVYRITGAASTNIGSIAVTDPPASWATSTIDVTDTTLADGDGLILLMTTSAAGIRIGSIQALYDHP